MAKATAYKITKKTGITTQELLAIMQERPSTQIDSERRLMGSLVATWSFVYHAPSKTVCAEAFSHNYNAEFTEQEFLDKYPNDKWDVTY